MQVGKIKNNAENQLMCSAATGSLNFKYKEIIADKKCARVCVYLFYVTVHRVSLGLV